MATEKETLLQKKKSNQGEHKVGMAKPRVVSSGIRQQVEGNSTPSTPRSAELQSIQQRAEQQMAKQKAMQTPVATEQIRQAVEGTTPSTKQAQELASINKRAATNTPVVTEAVKKAMQGDAGNSQQSQELDSVMQRTIRNMPVVTERVRQAVEGTDTSTQQSQELQMIQDRTARALEAQKAVATSGAGNVGSANAGAGGSTSTSSSTNPSTSTTPYGFLDEYLESMQPTPEELEAERKRERRKAIFNAIGDGVSSLANLYFTTKGAPNSYNPADNMTRKQLDRYEKMLDDRKKDQEQYFNQYLRLSQLDENANWRKQQTEYQKQRDQLADQRYKEQQAQQAAKIAAEAERWKQEFEEKKSNNAAGREIQQAKIDADNKYRAATLAETKRYHDIMADNKDKATASKLRGKQLGFSDGDNNKVAIYENVWKVSWPQVYDTLVDEMKAAHDADPQNNPRVPSNMKANERQKFVEQNWRKFESTRNQMIGLSKIDPATMGSQVESSTYDMPGIVDDEDMVMP